MFSYRKFLSGTCLIVAAFLITPLLSGAEPVEEPAAEPVAEPAAAPVAEPASVDDAAKEAQIREHFKKAIDNFEMGEYKICADELRKVLELEPSTSLALELREQTGYRIFMRLLAKKPLDELARDFLRLAERETHTRKTDPEYIKSLIEDLGKDFETQWWAKLHIEIEVGQYAIPYLVELMRQKPSDLSNFSRLVVKGIGEEGVPALLTCLYSADMYLIESVVLVLGHIGDDRAIAHLKAVYENPNITETLRGVARESLEKLSGRRVEDLPSAKELFYDIAQKYYYRHPSIIRESRVTGYLLWDWSTEKNLPVWHEAPPGVYYDELAEQACYDSILVDPTYEPPLALLAATYFRQRAVADQLIAAAELGTDPNIDIIQRNLEYLQARRDELDRRTTLVTKVIGPTHLYRCLDRALQDADVVVATRAMDILAEVADGSLLPPKGVKGWQSELPDTGNVAGPEEDVEAEGTPLVRALDSSDERIRYAAASTLVDIDPATEFLHCERVVPTLCQALGEKAIWFALIVDADLQRQNQMKALFPPEKFVVTCMPHAIEALTRARDFPTPDLVLAGTNLPNMGAVKLVNDLRKDFRTKDIPIYMLMTADSRERDKQLFAGKVDGLIMQRQELAITAAMIQKEFQKRWQESIKAESEAVALRAAESLASINVRATVFTPYDALDILIRSAAERSDDIKKPCLQALAHLGRSEATEVLVSVFENMENILDVRLLAAEALAYCNPIAAYETLKRSLNEEEKGIRELVAIALGKAGLEGAGLRQVLLEQRIGPPVSGERVHEAKGIGDLARPEEEKVEEEPLVPTDPKGVVIAYVRAVIAAEPERWLRLLVEERRADIDDLRRRDPEQFKVVMAETLAKEVSPLKDAVVGEPIVSEDGTKATVMVEKEKAKTTFLLHKEEDGWRIATVEAKQEL